MGTNFCLSPEQYLALDMPSGICASGGIKAKSPALGNEFSSLPGC